MDEQTALSIEAREAALVAWLGNRRSSYRPEEIPDGLNPPTNEERSALQVYRFETGDPQRYFAYWATDEDGVHLTTWMGDRLARVSWAGYSYRCVFGDTRRNFRAEDTCGRFWSGTYYESAGSYVRMRRVKR